MVETNIYLQELQDVHGNDNRIYENQFFLAVYDAWAAGKLSDFSPHKIIVGQQQTHMNRNNEFCSLLTCTEEDLKLQAFIQAFISGRDSCISLASVFPEEHQSAIQQIQAESVNHTWRDVSDSLVVRMAKLGEFDKVMEITNITGRVNTEAMRQLTAKVARNGNMEQVLTIAKITGKVEVEALFEAVKKDDLDLAKKLVEEHLVDVNGISLNGHLTPLSKCRSIEMFDYLVSKGANVLHTDMFKDPVDHSYSGIPCYLRPKDEMPNQDLAAHARQVIDYAKAKAGLTEEHQPSGGASEANAQHPLKQEQPARTA